MILSFTINAKEVGYDFPACDVGKNDYLEKDISEYFEKNKVPATDCMSSILNIDDRNSLDKITQLVRSDYDDDMYACIYSAMNKRPRVSFKSNEDWRNNTHYVSCPKEKNKSTGDLTKSINGISPIPAPCVSKNYVDYTYLIFKKVLKCLDEDPRDYFSFINKESYFMTNIGNGNRVYGLTQLTTDPARDVNDEDGNNRDFFSKIFKEIKDKNNEYCSGLIDSLKNNPLKESIKGKGLNACSRASIPVNPERVLLYGVLYFKLLRYQLDVFHETKTLKGKTKNEFFDYTFKSPEDKKKIFQDLILYAYNGGMGTLQALLKTYSAKHPKIKNWSYEDFSRKFPSFIPTTKHCEQPKCKEISQYVTFAKKKVKNIQDERGGLKCTNYSKSDLQI